MAGIPARRAEDARLVPMSVTTDRELWESIVDSDAEVPPGHTAAELLPSLLDLLGENDPYLRDEVGYGVLARWVVQDQLLGPDELRYAVERLTPDLRFGLDGSGDDQAAVRRSYSALALAILAYRDVEDQFLDAAEVRRLLDAAVGLPARRDRPAGLGRPTWDGSTPPPTPPTCSSSSSATRHRRRRPPACARRAADPADPARPGRCSSTTRRTAWCSSSST